MMWRPTAVTLVVGIVPDSQHYNHIQVLLSTRVVVWVGEGWTELRSAAVQWRLATWESPAGCEVVPGINVDAVRELSL